MSNMEPAKNTQQQEFNQVCVCVCNYNGSSGNIHKQESVVTIAMLLSYPQALLDDFDYSDDEDDTEKRIAQQRERLEQQKTRLEER